MNSQEVFDLYKQCIIDNYGGRVPLVVARGEGSYFWDLDSKRYLDLFPGWGCSAIGHCHPKVVSAVREQVGRLIHMDNTFYTVEQARLAQMISQRSFGGQCFFCNSGAEAVEAAIKLARRATPAGRYKIITMEKSFHGRTYGAMSATAQSKAHTGYEPLLAGFVYVPYNDLAAVEKAIDDETAAILVEPVQGEGGVNIAADGYLAGLRELADRHSLVLIFDEVQTGCGRTGRWFGHQHWSVLPDVMTLAKSLGGGAPIGAIVAKPEVAAAFTPGSHASTYGGNPLVVSAAIATIEAIDEENLLENAEQMGRYARQKAEALAEKLDVVAEVRTLGLMIGIELKIPGTQIAADALQAGLRINCTQNTVLRMLPAMNITQDQLDEGFEIIQTLLARADERGVS